MPYVALLHLVCLAVFIELVRAAPEVSAECPWAQ